MDVEAEGVFYRVLQIRVRVKNRNEAKTAKERERERKSVASFKDGPLPHIPH